MLGGIIAVTAYFGISYAADKTDIADLPIGTHAEEINGMMLTFKKMMEKIFVTTKQRDEAKKIAEEIQKHGGFIPGIRPGTPTANYLNYILTRITLAGALFLGLIAILPSLARLATGISYLTIGGTSILIVVSVVLETVKQIESQLVMRNYEGFLK